MVGKQRTCAYCGKSGARREMTQEHFVPRCLWEGRRPNRTETVWVHHACNAGHSKDDEFFRTAIVSMHGTERHREAIQVQNGPLSRLMRNRPNVLFGHLRNLGVRPIESPSGLYLGNRMTFNLDVPRFLRVLRKIILGLYYCKTRKPLASDYSAHLVWENQYTRPLIEPMFPFMLPNGGIADFGDDVFIYRWLIHPDDERVSYWCLGFYRAVSFFAATLPNREADERGGVLNFLNVSPMAVWPRY
jgi:hypothetical protein